MIYRLLTAIILVCDFYSMGPCCVLITDYCRYYDLPLAVNEMP